MGTVGYVASAGGTGGYLGCWYAGHDSYGGLTAFAVHSSKIPTTGRWNVEGWIHPGDRPALQ